MKTFDIINVVLTPIAYLMGLVVLFIALIAFDALVVQPLFNWFN